MKALIKQGLDRLGYQVTRKGLNNPHKEMDFKTPAALLPQHVAGCKVVADRTEIYGEIPAGSRIVELGTALANGTFQLLQHIRPSQLTTIDTFVLHERRLLWGRPVEEFLHGMTHEEFVRDRLRNEIEAGVVQVLRGNSSAVLANLPDSAFDMIYIDAGHDYGEVLEDATVAARKLKPDGTLIFNDYIIYDYLEQHPYGVVHVANEFCVERGWRMSHFALQPGMFCDVALRRS